VIGVTIFVALFIGIIKTNFSTIVWISGRKGIVNADTTLTKVGENLMTNFILPFEIAAVLLMVALIGSAFIASQIVKKRNN
jgi:NADH-quinone oxidoreductase subunit J